jgi:hypothetical protein
MTNEFLNIWLEQAAVSFGVVACGVYGTDKTAAGKTSHEQFTEPKIHEMMRNIAEMVQGLRDNQIRTQRVCWTFEKNRLYCATRDDGAIAALVVGKDLDSMPVVDWLLTEFHQAV